jgi:hypothetical protein
MTLLPAPGAPSAFGEPASYPMPAAYYPEPVAAPVSLPPPTAVAPPAPPVMPCVAHEAVPASARASAHKAYIVELKLVEVRPGKPDHVLCAPKLQVVEGATATMHAGPEVALEHGSVRDLLPPSASRGAEEVQLGSLVNVKVTRGGHGHARLDLSIQKVEVERATKNGLVMMGSGLRAVQKVHLGKVVKFPLEKDDHGATRCRVELTLNEAED